MNGQIKKYIYIIGTICIMFFVGAIFLKILPWLFLIGAIAYILVRILGFMKSKKGAKKFDASDDRNENYKDPNDDYTTGEIIDVEYEDVNDKEK